MDKIGRNEMCPCGSGKKYKKCCMKEGGARTTGYTTEDRSSALLQMDRYVGKELGQEDDRECESFMGLWEERIEELDDQQMELSEAAYDMWFFCDARLNTGNGVIDVFLEKGPLLPPGERRYLQLLRETAVRLYEVEDVSPGISVTLVELPSGARVKVHELTGSRSLCRHDLLAARIISEGASGQPEIESGLLNIPGLLRNGVLDLLAEKKEEYRRKNPHAGDKDFYKEIGAGFFHDIWISSILDPQIPHLQNTDGEDLLIARVRFEVLDSAAVESAFDAAGELDREKQGISIWHWLGKNLKGDPVVLGKLVLSNDSLELESNSRQRGELGRALIEKLAGDSVRHRSTAYENMASIIREELRSRHSSADADAASKDAVPREVQEALSLDAYARHYREWIDVPVPALSDRTSRDAAHDPALRPKVADLIRELEGAYQRALMDGEPAYDPSWMWAELDLIDRSMPAHPPLLAHERLALMAPGLSELCAGVADQLRRRPGFKDASTVYSAEDIRNNFEIRRFLRELEEAGEPINLSLERQIPFIVNYELHRRKTFWVDESLAYMLAATDLDITEGELRSPFPCFAIVFTDRYTLSLAERMLSIDKQCPIAGHMLKAATVYAVEERSAAGRNLQIGFELDAFGADPPYLVAYETPLTEEGQLKRFLNDLAPSVVTFPQVANANPLQGLFHVVFNAILYATSAGVEPQMRSCPSARSKKETVVFSSEDVFFLPGAIEITHVRKLQELERVSSGREILQRFMVRGHWRRASPGWKDQRIRWIEPYWKGPDIAAVIEKTYKLKP